ncbi:serine/threonine-protein kinase 33 [Symphorus nematophorus]
MNMVSLQTRRETLENNVPIIRLENDADLREIYTFGRKLGQGSFGVVCEATHIETQTKWAIKKVCQPVAGSSKARMLWQEIDILRQVNHAHIIHLQELYSTAKMMYLVTELCLGGELKQLLQRKKFFTEDETRHIIYSLADAVVYLQKRNIVHRDLKLENILVKNSPDEDENGRIDIKVADFGLSVQTGGVGIENIMTEACGTLIYMAPEIMSGRSYTQWCDVWSIGVVMYMLLCGESPFVSKTKADLLKEITNKEVRFTQPIWATVSDAGKSILTCLLRVDPAYRMSAKQLLENPWITGDSDVPVIPANVLDMMHHYNLEQQERTKTLENLSLTSSEDTQDLIPVPEIDAAETNSNYRSQTELSPDSSLCTPATFTKLSHAGVKTSTQPSAKQCRPQDKKDASTRQKPTSDQRPSTSSKSRTVPRKLPAV